MSYYSFECHKLLRECRQQEPFELIKDVTQRLLKTGQIVRVKRKTGYLIYLKADEKLRVDDAMNSN